MSFWTRIARAVSLIGLLISCLGKLHAQSLPTNFYAEPIAGGWSNPTSIHFAGDHHLLLTEKRGLVWDIAHGSRNTAPVLDLQVEVLNNGDRGLLCVLADPDFESNGLIFLLYVVDPNQDGSDNDRETFGRVTSYVLKEDVNGFLYADLASRKVILGATWPQGIPSIHDSHAIGQLLFAEDGTLLISAGDGAHYDFVDAGGNDPGGFGPGKFPPEEDIGAFRSQSLTSLAGKVLRVDPYTGLGLADNPFYTGDPTHNTSRVFMLGLRNPFRMTIRPDGEGLIGRLHVGDVGWNTWEEINLGYSGENFGWPCVEGREQRHDYQGADPGSFCQDGASFKKPRIRYNHNDPGSLGFTGDCTAGLAYYQGDSYPTQYKGKLFFCEFSENWLRCVRLEDGQESEYELFGTDMGNPVDLITDPATGDLIYIGIGDDMIRRIRYFDGNLPPIAVAEVNPTYGSDPLMVELKGSASTDPEGAALAFLWDLGDGNTSTSADLVHNYNGNQNFLATLTVTDVGGKTASATQSISVGNTPPNITGIQSPINDSYYQDGLSISLDATGVDQEDDAAGTPLDAVWSVTLIHDHHEHPDYATIHGFNAVYTPESHGPGTYLKIALTVTDSRGLTDQESVIVYDATGTPKAHLVSMNDSTPRFGHSFEAVGHIEYPGLGTAELAWDFGDGTEQVFDVKHQEDVSVTHNYAAPGDYTMRLTARRGRHVDTWKQAIHVHPLQPGIAVFAPLVASRWISSETQWAVADKLMKNIKASGFEAEFFTGSSQDQLADWMNGYLNDGIRDYVVFLDIGAEAVYAGQSDGSLAEQWVESGNGILWSGYQPFARYMTHDGQESGSNAGHKGADDVLDAVGSEITLGSGHQSLLPPAIDLPSLEAFDSPRCLRTALLSPEWSVFTEYASDEDVPPESDAITLRHVSGGEYAQFYCLKKDRLKRAEVFAELFHSTLFTGLPAGPGAFNTLLPAHGAFDLPLNPTLTWEASPQATSYLVEVANDLDFEDLRYVASVGEVTRTIVDRPLQPAHSYYWRVVARNDFGYLASEVKAFTTASHPAAK